MWPRVSLTQVHVSAFDYLLYSYINEEAGLEENAKESKCMFMSFHWNTRQNQLSEQRTENKQIRIWHVIFAESVNQVTMAPVHAEIYRD
jgi:hypothetical protein